MISIALNFVNQSNDTNPGGIVIFQQNSAGPNEAVTAWRVFQDIGQGVAHPFSVPIDLTVAASDSYGTITPQLPAPNGTRFDMVSSIRGNQLQLSQTPASAPQMVEVYNELPVGAIAALVYRDGRLLSQKTGMGPGQKAQFVFEPAIYIKLNSEVQEGEIMDAGTMSDKTMISLLGIKSADIVMSGGGSGPDAQPIIFSLQNVTMA